MKDTRPTVEQVVNNLREAIKTLPTMNQIIHGNEDEGIKIADDLDGWKLYKTHTIDVTNQDIDGIETQETKIYIKQIDGEWFYKDVRRAKLNKFTTFKSYDGKKWSINGYIDCGWVDLND